MTVLRMRCVLPVLCWPFCACTVYDRSAHALCTTWAVLTVLPHALCTTYAVLTVLRMRCVWPFCACVVYYLCCADRSVHALCTTCAVLTALRMPFVLPVLFWPLCACVLYYLCCSNRSAQALWTTCAVLTALSMRCVLYLCCSDRSVHAFCTTCAVLSALRRHCVLPVLFWPLCTCQAGHHDDKDEEGVLHNKLYVIKYFVISVGFLPHSRVTGCTCTLSSTVVGVHI